MEPQRPAPQNQPQDREEPEKKRPTIKLELEKLEERLAPSSLFHFGGHHPYHTKPW